jgi:hypothetical protein
LNAKKKCGRTSFPSCLVNSVRAMYPDPGQQYTGFVQRSPVFKSKRAKK